MRIKRDFYLQKLIDYRDDDRVKVITGIRRCGKSYLVFELFVDWLHEAGITDDHIIAIQLDDDDHKDERRPEALSKFVKDRLPRDGKPTYVLIDEIQMCQPEDDTDSTATTFYDVLNSLVKKRGVSVYVTGSNSRMLSKDVATNFRDRGVEIRIWPLSFAEYRSARPDLDASAAWDNYLLYGGMPRAVTAKDDGERASYLEGLFRYVYNRDIVERYNLKDDYVLDNAIKAVSSSVGSLTNPTRLADAMKTVLKVDVSAPTLSKYLGYMEDCFLLSVAHRYDVKGKRYFGYPSKYYAVDVGLRNAKLNFRQLEKTHLMENVIYTELLRRGYSVDVGVVETVTRVKGRQERRQHEIDFVVNLSFRKVYIQSALEIPDVEKEAQETFSLRNSGDFFRKLVIVGGSQPLRANEDGIDVVGVIPFLLSPALRLGEDVADAVKGDRL